MNRLKEYVRRLRQEKREYRRMVARGKALPPDYAYVYKKINQYMWKHAGGSGADMLAIMAGALDLFESGAAQGQGVLEITGPDVAGFADELLRNARTYTGDWHEQLNRDIQVKLGQGDARKGARRDAQPDAQERRP
ncbi:MAG: DUF1048 domain-containing protein [Bifidobacteriaceae bacterium]|jgi:DNA-binding ferritin-like protein (Dps family)|nr:DUF1048 domain-containing protein [Bifidobacteriaceae bacterium]